MPEGSKLSLSFTLNVVGARFVAPFSTGAFCCRFCCCCCCCVFAVVIVVVVFVFVVVVAVA